MPKTHFENPFKQGLLLERYPPTHDETLQAWDSADELLLHHLQGRELPGKRIFILNDAYGALACALEGFEVISYSDSYLSDQALRLNSKGRLKTIHDLTELSGVYDFALVKIPKNLSFLEDELAHVSQHFGPDSQ